MHPAIVRLSALTLVALVALAPGLAGSTIARQATPTADASTATWEDVLQAGLDAGLTGVALRVERGDEVVFDGAAGLASLEDQTPLAPAERFRIASVTKTFTAVLVLQLVEAGTLSLDDTVSDWLDDPVVQRIPHVEQMTIRQLLNHTSGVYDYFDDDSPFWQDAYFGEGADWTRDWTPEEVLAYADGAKHAPYFAPGEGVHYSNSGFILLGLILEQAGGQSYAEQLRERIVDPLGLTDTFYAATEPVPGGAVNSYHLVAGELVNASTIHLSAYGAAAGIVSTTEDLARFIDALLDGELLGSATLEAMLTFIPSERPGIEWGLGIARAQTPSGESLGMGGDGPGAGARVFRLVESDITVVLLTNTGGDVAAVGSLLDRAVRTAVDSEAAST